MTYLLEVQWMNKLEIRDHIIPSGYKTKVFFIDGWPLYEYIHQWVAGSRELEIALSPMDDLAICWTDEYDHEGDARFMRFVLKQSNAIIPILSCPEDFDFSCIVIVVEVTKQDDTVIWKRFGKVDHSGESFEEEKRSGILHAESYSEEDWIRYGDHFASATTDSPEWMKWTGDHWSEELYRRRVNYTFPYYQNEQNIEWFASCSFEFNRKEYDAVVNSCYKDQHIT
jgi:hypothetical protein